MELVSNLTANILMWPRTAPVMWPRTDPILTQVQTGRGAKAYIFSTSTQPSLTEGVVRSPLYGWIATVIWVDRTVIGLRTETISTAFAGGDKLSEVMIHAILLE